MAGVYKPYIEYFLTSQQLLMVSSFILITAYNDH